MHKIIKAYFLTATDVITPPEAVEVTARLMKEVAPDRINVVLHGGGNAALLAEAIATPIEATPVEHSALADTEFVQLAYEEEQRLRDVFEVPDNEQIPLALWSDPEASPLFRARRREFCGLFKAMIKEAMKQEKHSNVLIITHDPFSMASVTRTKEESRKLEMKRRDSQTRSNSDIGRIHDEDLAGISEDMLIVPTPNKTILGFEIHTQGYTDFCIGDTWEVQD